MCGIAGLWLRNHAGERDLGAIGHRMAKLLYHRGPDAQTIFADSCEGIVFGQARLAVMDLSPAGAMPMTSANGRFVIAYNGEVYEHGAIRHDLEQIGIQFRGHSDTEVILESCAHFGVPATLPRLVGMFAFALWDKKERRLTLARDRFGIKPLYYTTENDYLAFASELKALFAMSDFRPTIDRNALADYMRFNYVPAPRSIFRNVHKLMPGHVLTVEANGTSKHERWWDLRSLVSEGCHKPRTISAAEAEEELDRMLRHVVGLRMVSDVPLGAFLSGGIDSSMVVAQMQAQAINPVRTFTIGFNERSYDESAHAEAVARHLGTDHTTLKVSPAEAMAVIPDLPTWYDEPFADSSQIPTYLISKLARSSVTVALSGDGGDEVFAGYNRYLWGETLWRNIRHIPLSLRRGFAGILEGVPDPLWSLLERVGAPRQAAIKVAKLTEVLRLADAGQLYRRLVSVWPEPSVVVRDGVSDWGQLADPAVAAAISPIVEQMQYLDASTYLPDDILTKVDRASMAVSLEARVPLLDHRLAAFAFSLPREMRLQGTTGKVLLKRVLARYIPRDIFERPKTGFGIPVSAWLREPLRDWAESLLDNTKLKDAGLEVAPIRAMWADHLSGDLNRETEIWTVLMYQAWHDRWSSATAG